MLDTEFKVHHVLKAVWYQNGYDLNSSRLGLLVTHRPSRMSAISSPSTQNASPSGTQATRLDTPAAPRRKHTNALVNRSASITMTRHLLPRASPRRGSWRR